MWGTGRDSECKCGGMCEMCHDDAPKTKEEKLEFLTAKETRLKEKLEKVGKIREKIAAK